VVSDDEEVFNVPTLFSKGNDRCRGRCRTVIRLLQA